MSQGEVTPPLQGIPINERTPDKVEMKLVNSRQWKPRQEEEQSDAEVTM